MSQAFFIDKINKDTIDAIKFAIKVSECSKDFVSYPDREHAMAIVNAVAALEEKTDDVKINIEKLMMMFNGDEPETHQEVVPVKQKPKPKKQGITLI